MIITIYMHGLYLVHEIFSTDDNNTTTHVISEHSCVSKSDIYRDLKIQILTLHGSSIKTYLSSRRKVIILRSVRRGR